VYNGHVDPSAILQVAISAVATGAVVVGGWSWLFRKRLAATTAASLTRGLLCGVVLIAVFEFSAQVRSIVAARLFPYIVSLRFGLLGAVLAWAILDVVLIGALMYVLASRGNLTTRWSGP
jgi:hypothetical protein